MTETVDIAIIGAGAAGLMAGIWVGRTSPELSVVALDGARKIGAKILVAGGGRCNVTHERVDERDYAGSSRNAVKKVLRSFDVQQTVAFFAQLGVALKREETGKLFPVTDSARTLLNALLAEAQRVGVRIRHPRKVASVRRIENAFILEGDWGSLYARRVILAPGGKSLPKSGSDGSGFEIAKQLGHSISARVFPALVPLSLPPDHILRTLSGLSAPATLEVRAGSGKKLASFTDATLCTHFGLSGPGPLNVSRHLIDATLDDPQAHLIINWVPNFSEERLDEELQRLGRATPLSRLRAHLPERLARALCEAAAVASDAPGSDLARDSRRRLVRGVVSMRVPVIGNRGFEFAEATAGGVPLSELHLDRMESRPNPGAFLCGEVCDVDGRIGGFNFQWAWSSGYLAGVGAARTFHES
jgi:predicted Rossmann fold flavoprotein